MVGSNILNLVVLIRIHVLPLFVKVQRFAKKII